MKLTKRRQEFLDHIYQKYQKDSLPVHYTDVAEAIGVSKWTAYDVLKVLENQGLLKRTYSTNEADTGRSVVVFSPTELADTFFQKERREITNPAEWETIFSRATELMSNGKKLPLKEAVNQVLLLMEHVDVKLEFCVYFLCILSFYLGSSGQKIKDLTVNVINASNEANVQLTLFVGAVVGMIIQFAHDELSPEMIRLVQQFLDNANQLSPEELSLLISFIKAS